MSEKQNNKEDRYDSSSANKVKTTLLLDKTLKKLAQLYALQNDITLQELVEKALKKELIKSERD